MRIKFLSVIASFLILSIAISSCLDSDDNYEYSSDATIHAFALDTIHGEEFEFTIDQINRLIFNRDSLPVGADTIIDSVQIVTLTGGVGVTSGPADTVVNTGSTHNLLSAMNKSGDEGIKLKVHAADGITTRIYTLQIRVHLQDPDSLVWKNMESAGSVFSTDINAGEQRCVLLDNDLWVYASNTTAYRTSTSPTAYGWTTVPLTGLPQDARPSSLLNFQGKLYMITAEGALYTSADGTAWTAIATAHPIKSLVGSIEANDMDHTPATLTCIQTEPDGTDRFYTTTDGTGWTPALPVPAGFPTENIYATPLMTANGVNAVYIMGMPLADASMVVPWTSINGREWADLANTAYDTYCPGMENPVIMYYGDTFYSFGGSLEEVYYSITGIAWRKVERKSLLPEAFKGRGHFSMVVDKDYFIWIVFGGNGTPNEVWRGRLNRLGFKDQM